MHPAQIAEDSFRRFADDIRKRVDADLAAWLARRCERARAVHPDVGDVAGAFRDLAVRGGKRLRPALAAAGFECFAPAGSAATRIGPALVALELLQTYLLVHDDWMDGDATRRGGPSVHAQLADRYHSKEAGAVLAILAGDLGSAYALEALLECDLAKDALVAGAVELAEMHHRVVLGQTLDVRAVARTPEDVERTHDLKTGSYTVRGPVRLGAALAGASDAQREGLEKFARPIGIAFQLRDDLMGVFGDPAVTGKPRGSDLRARKQTAVVTPLREDAAWSIRLDRADRMSEEELRALTTDIEKTGARARVESRIAALCDEGLSALAALSVTAHGRDLLHGAVSALTRREQ